MNKLLIEIKNLKKFYSLKSSYFSKPKIIKAVNNISFSINEGEILGFVGESGCGKSTTAKLLLRIIKADSGEILFKDKDVAKMNKNDLLSYRKDVQIIFQDTYSSLNPRWTVGKIISEPLSLNTNLSKKEIKIKVLSIMNKVGLEEEWYNRFPHQFSGGQRQRIGIARALILEPKLVICDEPVSALDVSIQAQILNLLIDLQKEFNLTYLFISHDLSVINHISDNIIVMNEGVIVEKNNVEEIMNNPQHEYTKKLFSAIPKIKY